jgi:hypothetical protein
MYMYITATDCEYYSYHSVNIPRAIYMYVQEYEIYTRVLFPHGQDQAYKP